MRVPAAFLAALLCLFPATGTAAEGDGGAVRQDREEASFSVRVSNRRPFQGEPVFLTIVISPPPDNVAVEWRGRRFPMRAESGGRFSGLIGVDLLEAPGKAPVAFHAGEGASARRAEFDLEIRERSFPVQELTVPAEMAEYDPETVDRIEREACVLAERLSIASGAPAWETPFVPPVEEYRPAGFGARRIINGLPRLPHAGVDVSLPEGTPVRAIANGTVALAAEQFFGGKSVVLDHGGGLFSIYYHLSESTVSEGRRVDRGDRIGAVGKTGRATGPHLHFGIRAAGGRIDPSLLFAPPPR